MVTLRAKEITLEQTAEMFWFRPLFRGRFEDFLTLQPITDQDQQELDQIADDLMRYLTLGNISEGQAKQISISPMLRLAGYHKAPIELRLEEDIQTINIKDQDTQIRGRMDLIAVNRAIQTAPPTKTKASKLPQPHLLWVLIVESKNLAASEFVGIAQMLTYAYTSLEHQPAVWGLVTNGATYQFFHITQGETPTYQYMPSLGLLERDRSTQLLQVLNAIRDWQP